MLSRHKEIKVHYCFFLFSHVKGPNHFNFFHFSYLILLECSCLDNKLSIALIIIFSQSLQDRTNFCDQLVHFDNFFHYFTPLVLALFIKMGFFPRFVSLLWLLKSSTRFRPYYQGPIHLCIYALITKGSLNF